jgi:hypothetical protein
MLEVVFLQLPPVRWKAVEALVCFFRLKGLAGLTFGDARSSG